MQNNILREGSLSASNSLVQNNIGNSTQFDTLNSNQQNVDMSTVFVSTGSSDGIWQLAVDSPALGAGLDGVDCGMFGDQNPYVLSGLPPLPAIYFFSAPSTGSSSAGLQVRIKGESHN